MEDSETNQSVVAIAGMHRSGTSLVASLLQSSGVFIGDRLDGKQEAHLLAIACSEPPQGQARWTLRLLADKMVELNQVEFLSHETVRQTLKKTNFSLGEKIAG